MNVSAWSIRNPIPAILFFIMLTLMGLVSFRAMKIQNFPDIDLPTISVTASLPGAAPPQMETEVARKIENSVATLQGVKHIYTKVQDSTATVTIEFRLEKPTQEALDEVRDAVSRIRSDLPTDLRDPVIAKMNLAGSPILTYTVASDRMDEEALSWFVDNNITKSLLSVRGVGAVSRVGGVTREVRVEPDPVRLLALGATIADISRQLRQIQQDASGGRADIGGIEQSVRTIATVQSAEELARMDIALGDGRQHTRDARDRGLHQAEQLREQDFLARNGRQGLHPVGIQSLACVSATLDDQLVVALGKVGDDFGRGDSVFGKTVDQRADHALRGHFERCAGNGATGERVLQDMKVHTLVARLLAQHVQVFHGEATVFSQRERL